MMACVRYMSLQHWLKLISNLTLTTLIRSTHFTFECRNTRSPTIVVTARLALHSWTLHTSTSNAYKKRKNIQFFATGKSVQWNHELRILAWPQVIYRNKAIPFCELVLSLFYGYSLNIWAIIAQCFGSMYSVHRE